MDRPYRPERFDADPSCPSAAKVWNHGLRIFTLFIARAAKSDDEKLEHLIGCVSPTVYEYITESETFQCAMTILEKLYMKPRNEVFARHTLSTSKQEAGLSLDQFMQKLKSLAKDCKFVAVTVEQNQNSAI
ncbi:unnamed protein product [Echinostoma caproni]|uniref:Protein kinase domain-containing protein n=1 Tax=Echinostoma caproni TaxID=27848 RepID=A0A183AKP2_9TREM|nr:unnamed protein product [Echinostoma caproni]